LQERIQGKGRAGHSHFKKALNPPAIAARSGQAKIVINQQLDLNVMREVKVIIALLLAKRFSSKEIVR
jgi:hypothetical protein